MKTLCKIVLGVVACGFLHVDARVTKMTPSDAARPSVAERGGPVKLAPGEMIAASATDPGLVPTRTSLEFDARARRNAVVALVEKGIAYLKDHSLPDALNRFTGDVAFRDGEIYLYVYDMQGVCLAIGKHKDLIWQNRYDYRDEFGARTVYEVIETARRGGGWLTYFWYGATKIAWVQKAVKDGVELAIGAGYYPFSKEDEVVNLVRGAVTVFHRAIQEGGTKNAAFALYGYPRGRFALGDLYLYVISFTGEVVAHGEMTGLIGTNGWDYQDSNGMYVNREIVQRLKRSGGAGIWIEYMSKGARKRAYAERVVDHSGTEYFIACGYYPDVNRRSVENLVAKAYALVKSSGLKPLANQVNDPKSAEFRSGDAYIMVFDQNGNCLAHGRNPDAVGRNMYNDRDENGRLYVREIVQRAQEGNGWLDFKLQRSFMSWYVEMVNTGIDRYIVCSGLYPDSKLESMILLVKSAADFLRDVKQPKDAFKEFVRTTGNFVRGDLFIFVVDSTGTCLVYGDEADYIWKDASTIKIDDGRSLMQVVTEIAGQGAGTGIIRMNGIAKVVYVQMVEAAEKTYFVGSSFFK